MCFIRKRLKHLETDLSELTRIVKNREYQELKRQSEDFETTKKLLENVKIDVKEIKTVLDQDTMDDVITIKYELPIVTIRFDENGDPYKNELFYSLNSLNLISYEDMEKIQKQLDKIKLKKIQE